MDRSLDLVQLLHLELPVDFPADGSSLTPDQERQLAEAQTRILSSLVIGHDERTRSSFFSSSISVIEGFIKGILARTEMLMLGIAYLVYHVVDARLYRKVYGCTSKAEYFQRTSLLDIYSASTLENLRVQGFVLEDFQFVLMSGSHGVPPFSLEFIASRRTMLLDFPKAVQLFQPRRALEYFRDDDQRTFSERVKVASLGKPATDASTGDGQQPAASPADDVDAAKARTAAAKARSEERRRIAAERQAEIDDEVAAFSVDDTAVVHAFQAGYVPHVAMAPDGHPDFLDSIEDRLVAYRDRMNREVAERIGHDPSFDPENPIDLRDAPGRLSNIFEIEARIHAANASVAEGNRTYYGLMWRLYNEKPLVEQWKALGYLSFEKYSAERLGIRSGAYTDVEIGRVLLKYRHLIADLPNRDAKALFPMLANLEHAIVTHRGDYLAVAHAISTLGVGKFKDFAKDASYIMSLYARPVTRAMLEDLYSYRSMLAHYRERGHAVKVVALYERDEQRIVDRLFREMLAELDKQAPEMTAALMEEASEEPTVDAKVSAEDVVMA
jgi:hypothetical protein